MSSIAVTLKLFAAYQDALGQSELALALEPGTTVANLCDRICTEYPSLQRWQALTRFGVNLQFVPADTLLQDGDEVVFIPPVSGG